MIQQADPGDQAHEPVAVEDDGDVAGVEDRQQGFYRLVDLHGLQPVMPRAARSAEPWQFPRRQMTTV
jgi:hypothetical protein